MKKKVVYFLPDNPIGDKAGNTTRCFQLLSYFYKNKEFVHVDFVSFLPWSDASIAQFKALFPAFNLILIPKKGPKKTNYLKYFLVDKLPKLWRSIFGGRSSISLVTPYIEKQLKNQLNNKRYDIALVSYASWASLIQLIDAEYSIIDTHDFITKQFIDREKNDSQHKIGRLFQQEINLLQNFNEVWSYSLEEHYIFEQ
ncbi:MAG: glycosyltransferase, partial [Sphingobacterium sp.]